MPIIAERLENLPTYVFATIGQKIRQMQQSGIDVIRMDMGSPDLPPADFVREALAQSVEQENHHGYSGYTGISRFRQAVADYYAKRFEVTLNPDTEILPLIGSKEGIVNLCLAYIDDGDTALIPSIGYPAYNNGVLLAGGTIEYVAMPADNDFFLDVDAVKPDIAEQANLLWCNYPNNPTGAIADLAFYEKLVSFCQQYDILLASDNPYCDVTYDGYRAPSILQVPDAKATSVEFMSMSKTFNMAGWRLGAMVGNAEAVKNLLKVKSNVDSGHFIPIYDAGIAAMKNTSEDWLRERNAIYQARRDAILQDLGAIGLQADTPKASLYIWAKVEDMSALEYVEQARSQAHVSIAPGAAYGPGGEGYVRISLTASLARIEEAMSRLKAWYSQR